MNAYYIYVFLNLCFTIFIILCYILNNNSTSLYKYIIILMYFSTYNYEFSLIINLPLITINKL